MQSEQTQLQLQKQEKWKTRAYMGAALLAACGLVWVCLYIMGILWQAVATVVLTAIIAFMLHGLVNYLEKRKLPRGLASLLALVGLLVVLAAFVGAFASPIADQVKAFSAALPEYLGYLRDIANQLQALSMSNNSVLTDLINSLYTWVQEQSGALIKNAAGGIFLGVFGVGNALLITFIAFICAYWILADLPTISRELMSLFTEDQQRTVRVITNAFSTAVYGWAKATFICAIIVGVANGLAFMILGIPYFALLGLLCGVLYFIPYIGTIVAAVIVVPVGLLVSPAIAIVALIINAIIHNVVANVFAPKLMESSTSVHPAVILIAILVGGALGGIPGILFSIPIVAAIQGVFVTFFEERTGKQLATEDGALFQKPKVKVRPTFRKREKKRS